MGSLLATVLFAVPLITWLIGIILLTDSQSKLARPPRAPCLPLTAEAVAAAAVGRTAAFGSCQTGDTPPRRDIRLTIALNKLTPRRSPVLSFLGRTNPLNRQLGLLRHRAMRLFGQSA